MARIIIASASEASRTQLARLLSASGFSVFRLCAGGSELRRTLNTCEDGVLVIAGSVSDCLIDALVEDFGDCFHILLIGRPDALSACESPKVFKLAWPCSGSAAIGAIQMLSQLHAMRLPRRAGDDKALVEQAKALLMETQQISEPEAHRRMQQYAMRHNIKMTDYAELILKEN